MYLRRTSIAVFRKLIWAAAMLTFGATAWLVAAQGAFRITNADLSQDGFPRITFTSPSGSYYIVYRSGRPDNGFVPARMSLSSGATTTVVDGAARGRAVFYFIRQVPAAVPLDLDQDGIDDVYELNRPEFLNPLYNIDAQDDFDGDGIVNVEEYRRGTDPASGVFFNYTTFISSPDNGESGVSVNRETVLLFDRPLAASVVLTTNQFFTTVGGRKILSRLELASDRRSASLFYNEPLPASSRVKVTFDGTAVMDNTGHVLDADHDGKPGGVAVIEFDTATITPIPTTAVIGRVFASELTPGNDTGTNAVDRPLAGVFITVDGAEQDLRTQTAADGSFTLDPAPAGEFFVHIDGREAAGSNYPDGDYYPRVGKKWFAKAGVSTNLAGGDGKIFLPLVQAGTLKAVSPVADTMITFPTEVVQANPALDGVRITVPANSLFSETGVRGGQVGIAPVPPDRLPSALPDRLSFPLVVTVQTDGPENFDRPVPVQFPNLPDPKTGGVLPPGEKTALWSFNHDMGNWEVVGAMTISADGKFAVSDPGVGIRAPGWHGVDPGSGGGCDKPRGGGGGGGGGGTSGGGGGGGGGAEIPPGGDGPDGPDAGDNGGGSGGGTSGGTGGDGCEAGDCGCDLTGAFAKPEETEAPKKVLDAVDPQKATSPNGLYRLQVFNSSSGATFEVKKVSTGTTVLLVGPLPMEVFGFSPDDHRFVYSFKDGAGNTSVWLHDLENPTSGGPSSPFVPAWKRTVSAASYSVGFSPHGNFLLFAYNLRSNDRHVAMAVARAKGGLAYEAEYDISALGGTGSSENAASWGWGPECDDRSLVYAYVNAPNGTTVRLVNLKTGNAVMDRSFGVGEGEWSFSKCGDVFGMWHFRPLAGPGQAILVKSATGTVLADVQNIPGGPVTFSTTASSHVVNIQGNETQFPNEAGQPCSAALTAFQAAPETPVEEPVSTGLHYYGLQDLVTGQMIERGLAGSAGVVHTRLILGVNRPYRSYVIKAETLQLGWTDFISGNNGQHLRLPDVLLRPDNSTDTDSDGLRNLGELIMGTNPTLADSDNDGLSDSSEVIQGSNPNDGLAVATGVIGAAPTGGNAVDVVAVNSMAVVAAMDAGVSLFNVFNGLAPTLVAQVNTPGRARGVAVSGSLIAVADDTNGLVVIDASQPSSASIIRQVPMAAAAQAVVAAAGVAYVGMVNGDVVAVDMPSGAILATNRVNGNIQDLAFVQDTLYVLTPGTLHVLDLNEDLRFVKSVAAPGGVGAGQRRLRISAGVDRVYTTFTQGFNAFDTTDPLLPVLIKQNTTGSQGWKHIVANGSGSALAAVGRNSTDDGPHDVSIYDLGPNRSDENVQGTFVTPGLATAVSIYNGILYVADGTSGLTVINYLAYDAKGIAPTISLAASFPLSPAQAEEGKAVRISASVTDDVQVRDVQFYIDDVLVSTDGNYPFEARVVLPVRTSQKTSFTLKAKATDTGGNLAWAGPITVALVQDATVPRIKRVSPGPADVVSNVPDVTIFFSEPMDTAALAPANLQMSFAGPDYLHGTPDDSSVPYTLDYRGDFNAASLRFAQPLAPGFYRLFINGARDLAGNPAAPMTNLFWTLPDGPEGDPDKDDLINSDEILARSNPLVADTDGDGWIDGIEVADRRDPLNPESFPRIIAVASPPVGVRLESVDDTIPTTRLVVSSPQVSVLLQSLDDTIPANRLVVSSPQVSILLQPLDDTAISPFRYAQPLVGIDLPPSDENLTTIPKLVVARPLTEISLPSVDTQFQPNGVRIANPPVSVRFVTPLQQQAFKPNSTESPNL